MKFEAVASALADQLTFVERALTRKLDIRALGAVRITANADAVTLAGNDLDIATSACCSADIEEAGEAAVSAKALRGLIDGLSKDAGVIVVSDGTTLQVSSGRSRYRLEIIPIADLPNSFDPGEKAADIT